MLKSDSEKNFMATQGDIVACFRLLLGRHANLEELSGHLGRAGEPLEEVVRSFLNSYEFERRNLIKSADRGAILISDQKTFKIFVSESDLAVGKHLLNGVESYEPQVQNVFHEHLEAGMFVLDIGANIGFFSLLAASIVGEKGSVFAFEPNPENTKMIEASRRLNGFDNITIVQAAVGKDIDLLVYNADHTNGTTSQLYEETDALLSSTTVPSLPLDRIIDKDRPIDFIKIDIEGAEYNAIRGGEAIIQKWHPIIVSEFSPGQMIGRSGASGIEYLQRLRDLGYKIAVLEASGSVRFCSEIDEVMTAYKAAKVDHIDIVCKPIN